jgi:hypothetical protein
MKPLEERWEMLHDIGIGKKLLDKAPGTQEKKAKTDK